MWPGTPAGTPTHTSMSYPDPPRYMVVGAWLEWMADHPCLSEAIDTVIARNAHYMLLAHCAGRWEREHKIDADARFDRRLKEAMARWT